MGGHSHFAKRTTLKNTLFTIEKIFQTVLTLDTHLWYKSFSVKLLTNNEQLEVPYVHVSNWYGKTLVTHITVIHVTKRENTKRAYTNKLTSPILTYLRLTKKKDFIMLTWTKFYLFTFCTHKIKLSSMFCLYALFQKI